MIYLDNAATTAIFPEVLEAMLPWFQPDHVGNPSSIHTQGINARHAVDKAREQVAQMIGADASEIFFTSGGTESNNAWLQCASNGVIGSSTILTTKIEHSSVLEPIKNSIRHHIKYIKVHSDGSIDLDDLDQLLNRCETKIGGVSVMWVNNELGTVNPMKEIGILCKKYNVLFHTDAVAAAGHVEINVHDCNVDFLSLSGHKFGAPQGIGVLYISNRVQKKPWIWGGGQENGLRGGTENVSGIVGIGAAAEIVSVLIPHHKARWGRLRNVFCSELDTNMYGEYRINGNEECNSSNIISLTIPGANSESLLLLLDQQDIYLSAGSACSASDTAASHVLRGIGMSEEDAACTIRISMGFGTMENEMIQTAKAITAAVRKLKSMYS